MGSSKYLPACLGALLLVIIGSSAQATENEPVRMASDSLIVPEYKRDSESDLGSSVITLTDDNTEYQIYQGVMGRPGVDFPVHPHIPATSFTCRDIKRSGYYADLETDCQVFHICDGGRKISFICPNGTIFRQSHLICDWWFRVDCGKSVELYEESAEQLAADQKLFQERAEERERRRKLVKTLRGEPYKPDIFKLEETRNGPPLLSSTTFPPLFTTTSKQVVVDRKPERNSKRVLDATFADYYPNQANVVNQPLSEARQDERSGKLSGAHDRRTTLKVTSTFPTVSTQTSSALGEGRRTQPFVSRIQHVFAVDKALFAKALKKSESTSSQEVEKQHLAESASFASHRNGRYFNNFVVENQQIYIPTTTRGTTTTTTTSTTTTTTNIPYKFISTGTSKSVELSSSKATEKVHKPNTKSLEDRLKYVTYPTTSSPVYKPTIPVIKISSTPSTTYTASHIPIDDIYFTTREPEINATMKSYNPEIAISLQELDINKQISSTNLPQSYDSSTREGLNIPPSSGPASLRSLALYFAGPSDYRQKETKRPYFANNVLVIPLSQEQEQKLSGKTTIQEVDKFVYANKKAVTTPKPTPIATNVTRLPSLLTPQTRNSYSQLFENASVTTEAEEITTTISQSYTEPTPRAQSTTSNDLSSSQSRGIVEPDPNTNQIDNNNTLPNLRELAQIFTKALSAYLDDPEGFRRVLSEIRPTEPATVDGTSAKPIEYPSATQEEDEVLDFSDVTKSPNKKKSTTALNFETTTEIQPSEIVQTTTVNNLDLENSVLPLSANLNTSESQYPKPPAIHLTAPTLETLDESQSSYYTPSPSLPGTTNAIAEEINKEFSKEALPEVDSNEAVDSYFPTFGSDDDQSRPRYGGFQNNSNYSPYGSELTTRRPELPITTFNPSKNRTQALYNKLNLIVNQARQDRKLKGTSTIEPPQVQHQAIQLGNGETLERTLIRTTPRIYLTTSLPERYDTNPEEINLELSPPAKDVRGFLITQSWNNDPVTYLPTTTATEDATTTEKPTTHIYVTETYPPTTIFEPIRTTEYPATTSTTEFTTATATASTTTSTTTTTTTTQEPFRRKPKMGKSFERLMELQQTLMFNSSNVSQQQKDRARLMVEETMNNVTMSDTTATTLMRMMELAAKNETYRRLVLLLVNDRSGKDKTVEEARVSLLRALLTPVINQEHTRTTTETRTRSFRRGKQISAVTESSRTTQSRRVTTTSGPNKQAQKKATTRPRILMTTVPTTTITTTTTTTTTPRPSTIIGNLGIIRKTIENSRNKEIKINSLEDAILDSDSRAIELLRSLYSLAARWG